MKKSKESGTAITEFLTALLTLVPMFALFTLIGKLSDAEHAVQEGARYQAWEKTVAVGKSRDDLKAEVHQRIFEENTFIQSADESADAELQPNRHLWGMYGKQSEADKEGLFSFDEDGYRNSLANESAGLDDYSLSVDVHVVGEIGISDLEEDGLYNAKVGLSVNDVSWLGYEGEANCGSGSRTSYLTCIDRNNAVLVDDWSAGSPDTVAKRVADLNPQLLVWKPLADGLDEVLADPIIPIQAFIPLSGDFYRPFEDIENIKDAPGYVLPDVVPPARLGSYEDRSITQALD